MRKILFPLLLLLVGTLSASAIDAPSSVPMEPDHCIAVTWERRKEVDFTAFLDPSSSPFLANLYVTANGKRCEGNKLTLSYWCPGSLNPDIYYVALWHEEVWPFILALQPDGNPVHISGLAGIPRALSRPCLIQGPHPETYLRLRPPILP